MVGIVDGIVRIVRFAGPAETFYLNTVLHIETMFGMEIINWERLLYRNILYVRLSKGIARKGARVRLYYRYGYGKEVTAISRLR